MIKCRRKNIRTTPTTPGVQRGAALLLFLLLMITVAAGFMVSAFEPSSPFVRGTVDRKVLQQAKEALLGYALTYAEINPNSPPGYLPCPDFNGDGLSDAPCGAANQSAIGRLPWRTLKLGPLRDSSGNCLWYAVSGRYKPAPAGAVSTEADGRFLLFDETLNSLNGPNQDAAAIAVIIAPGSAHAGQNRNVSMAAATECGSTNAGDGINIANRFMDNLAGIDNASGFFPGPLLGLGIAAIPSAGFSAFVKAAPVEGSFNDALAALTAQDFRPSYEQMQHWVARRVRACLAAYATVNGGRLPWPAALNPAAAPNYDDNDTQQRFGRIPADLSRSVADSLTPVWPPDPLQPATTCFDWAWWPNFRETVFLVVDAETSPIGGGGAPVLTIDGLPQSAALLVGGRRGGMQRRQSNAQKAAADNYLESSNAGPAAEVFVSQDVLAGFFNDYVCNLNNCP